MFKKPSSPRVTVLYVLLISLSLIGILALLLQIFGSERKTRDPFTSQDPLISGEVRGASERAALPVRAYIQAQTDTEIILQITNPTNEPVFFEPARELIVFTAAGQTVAFEAEEKVIVVLSREAKNITLTGDFEEATTLELTLPEIETTLTL